MKRTLYTLFVIAAAGYGGYRLSLDVYVAARRDFGEMQYKATRQAIDDSMNHHSGFLLEFPPESRRRFKEN